MAGAAVPIHDWRHMMRRLGRIIAMLILMAAMATAGPAQTGAITPDQMRMMGDQMKGGKMTPDQMKMMGEHMQMMADRMKSGQMTADETKMMREHMKMLGEHMKMRP